MKPLVVTELKLHDFRNLAAQTLSPCARLNVLYGENGQGKTNVLEAIYSLCTTRSFRTSRPVELVRHDAAEGSAAIVRGTFVEDGSAREQSIALRKGVRVLRIDGARPKTLAEYAARTPVVVFSPQDVGLAMGSGGERRKLLDRVSLYRSAVAIADLDAYGRALRERQLALELRGDAASDLDTWEELIVRYGLAVMTARTEAADPLAIAAGDAFARIGTPGLSLRTRYATTAPRDEGPYRDELRRRRLQDRRRGSASVGPHRDDLELLLGEHSARAVASQGQHRAIVLALKSAELRVVGSSRDAQPILLLDDVSSELDRARTAALFRFLEAEEGQIFLTTTRKEVVEEAGAFAGAIRGGSRLDVPIVAGRIGEAPVQP
ncbi:DNA replication/repair protein RecF [soil metagenome]